MNQKDTIQGYARLLDRVAGNQVPQDLDLAPQIRTRIQKRKGFPMQPRMKFFTAAGLVAIVMIIMISTVPGMAATIGRWFGYVPGIGFVREGQLRVLAEPVSITRAGVTLTVEQVIIDPERTTLVYSVDSIPDAAVSTQPQNGRCLYDVSLRLPDGSPLLAPPNGIQGWSSGYQHRFNYPPLPPEVNDATLLIPCLFNTRSGKAPENWEIPLHFIPAPPDMTAFPVIELSTPTAGATAAPTDAVSPTAAAEVDLTLTLDRAVQMDDGYLLYATLHWQDTPFLTADLNHPEQTLHLLDGNGQEMLYEVHYDDQTGVFGDERKTVFAIKTAPVQTSGPLTLVLDSVLVEQPVETSFVFDPGPNPQPDQKWQLNQEIAIGEHNLLVTEVIAHSDGYEVAMTSDTGILGATCTDRDHPIFSGYGGGDVLGCGFNYQDKLPGGPVTVLIGSIGVRNAHPLQAQWTPPAASPNLLPTRPAACLTAASWKTALAQKADLPKEITGRVLTSGLVNAKTGQWNATLSNLDGSNPQVFEGAQDGAISPDGAKLVYSVFNAGISVADLVTSKTEQIPGTANGDFNPIWSPDGKQIVFMRGMGIFDLFIVEADGANMHQVTHGGVQEWPVGWLPDGRLVYTVPGRENEYTNFAVDVQSGKTEEMTNANLSSITPDGQNTLTSERTFGDRWLIYISALDGANRWLLNDSNLWVLTPVLSPDRQWLLAGVSATDSGSTIGALINLRTCQVIPLPNLKGNFLSWIP